MHTDLYLAAAALLAACVQFVRTHPSVRLMVWSKIPSGWRWLPPILAGAVTGFVDAATAGKPMRDALIAALVGIAGISLPAMGAAAALKESKLPWH